MNQTIKDVREFSEVFGKLVNYSPQLIHQSDFDFIYEFIKEELKELKEAHDNNNLIDVADALVDIQYVLNAGILAYGLQNCFEELFDEVQRSNMSKSCKTIEEVEGTIKLHESHQGPCHWEKHGDVFIVYRTRDRKVMKSINYFKPDLKSILIKYI